MDGDGIHGEITGEALYELCQRHVHVATRILGDLAESEDLVHALWLKVTQALHTFDPEKGRIETWLRRLIRNHAIDQHAVLSRTEARDPAAVEVHVDRVSMPDTIPEPIDPRLQLLLGRLPSDWRDVLLARHLAGLSVAETAASLGRSPGQVSVLDHRARSFLKERLAPLGPPGRGQIS